MRFVVPAKAGIQGLFVLDRHRIRAFAGMKLKSPRSKKACSTSRRMAHAAMLLPASNVSPSSIVKFHFMRLGRLTIESFLDGLPHKSNFCLIITRKSFIAAHDEEHVGDVRQMLKAARQ